MHDDRRSPPECTYRWLFLLPLLFAAGCGNDPLGMVPVSGTVTFDGQGCPAAGNLGFIPLEAAAGLPRRGGHAEFGTDGKYQVTSFRDSDGLVPGRYAIRVRCYSQPVGDGMSDQEIEANSLVAKDHQVPELVVKQGSRPIEFDIDLPLRQK